VFERFTDRARLIVVLAQEEARTLGHDYIGTEHLLLGLLRDEDAAARIFDDFDVDLEALRNEVIRVLSSPESRERRERRRGTGPLAVSPAPMVAGVLGPFPARRPRSAPRDPADAWPVVIGHDLIGDLGNPLVDQQVLLAILAKDGRVAKRLRRLGIDEATVRTFLAPDDQE
jgi:hypothetical protein